MTSFIGGSQDEGVVELSSSEIVQQVHRDTREILLNSDAPFPKVLAVRTFQKAIPQYNM
jgi:protoporphyrinogen oxidase